MSLNYKDYYITCERVREGAVELLLTSRGRGGRGGSGGEEGGLGGKRGVWGKEGGLGGETFGLLSEKMGLV